METPLSKDVSQPGPEPSKVPSNFVAVAFEVFLSAVDGLVLDEASADAVVEKYIVRDMIPTMSEDMVGCVKPRSGHFTSACSACRVNGQRV